MPENTVKVDRTSGVGNPFPVVKGSSTYQGVTEDVWIVGTWTGPAMWFRPTREEAIRLSVDAYRAMMSSPSLALSYKAKIAALRGKNLACWCKLPVPGEPDICHAAVLLDLANRPVCEEVAP